MYAPHTITVYTVTEDMVTFEVKSHITVLRGVLVDESKGANVLKSGLSTADSVVVFIPFSVDAKGKAFLPEKEYMRLSDAEKERHWTLRPGNDFMIRGEVVEPNKTLDQLNQKYDSVYAINSVDTKDFGTEDMRHWQVGGS